MFAYFNIKTSSFSLILEKIFKKLKKGSQHFASEKRLIYIVKSYVVFSQWPGALCEDQKNATGRLFWKNISFFTNIFIDKKSQESENQFGLHKIDFLKKRMMFISTE